ncbi:hypothetical protein N7520_009936 [Penicillium odoratum]|uniref:uncharacterized protein n=1 Tax=Penicillium odoratum TaxID=1167516 RepID=UPI0025499A4C|nr:uncharacterized protein N7520_009936 [Penicillium odoratum]KAJ5753019.1 hypothetical protein N7520_009936 [Penicillium odoratum]
MSEAGALPTQPSPFISIEGVPNVRDIGGHACHPPATVLSLRQNAETKIEEWCIRPGLLFRAAQPSQITPPGVETLTQELHIQAIFDLRSKQEIDLLVARSPNSLLDIPGTTRYATPVFRFKDFSPGALAKRYGVPGTEVPPREVIIGGFVQAYEEIARSAAETDSFRTIMLHILQNPDAPILFHCTAGKDRTGVFAALLLKLCGVADDIIVADYALTTEGLGAWGQYLIQRILDKGEVSTREQAKILMGSPPDCMSRFLNEVVAVKFGGARKYFVGLCGLKESELDQIIAMLTVPKTSDE